MFCFDCRQFFQKAVREYIEKKEVDMHQGVLLSDASISNEKFCLCLSETTVTRATLALHRRIIPLWNQDDPRIEKPN